MKDKKTLGWNPTYFGEPKKGSLAAVVQDITDKQNAVVGEKPEVQSSAAVQAKEQQDNQEAYFAGIIDGEGWISYEKASKPNSDYRIPCIGVEMTDEDVIRKLHSFFSSGTVISMKKRVEHHKQSWRWKARGKAAVAIFFKIYN